MAKTEGVDRLTKQEVLSQINTWTLGALSDYNDGWTKKHYMDILREIQEILNESLPIKEVKFEDTPDDEMCF
jgi:hypothetical protein|tara:strand:- start:261 stop:476 length:216 start_codon:yes stop_codon:yes gene_type:complete